MKGPTFCFVVIITVRPYISRAYPRRSGSLLGPAPSWQCTFQRLSPSCLRGVEIFYRKFASNIQRHRRQRNNASTPLLLYDLTMAALCTTNVKETERDWVCVGVGVNLLKRKSNGPLTVWPDCAIFYNFSDCLNSLAIIFWEKAKILGHFEVWL